MSLELLSMRNSSGGTFFHEACEARSLALLNRVTSVIDAPIPHILNTRNYNGELCTHIIAKFNDIYAQDMMAAVVSLGANINGKEACGGFTPLHMCVWYNNYALAEWLCNAPGIDLEAENYRKQTVYQLAFERKDQPIMDLLKKAGATCEPPEVESSDESD